MVAGDDAVHRIARVGPSGATLGVSGEVLWGSSSLSEKGGCCGRLAACSAARRTTKQGGSGGVVEDDPERVSLTRSQTADAVAEVDPVMAARPPYRSVVDGEHDA